jgi:hypothetical protein
MPTSYPLEVVEEHDPEAGLRPLVETFHPIMIGKAEEFAVPSFSLKIVLSGDLDASIASHGEPGFQPERLGGQVAGKTLAQLRDFSNVTIVLRADATADADPLYTVFLRIGLLAHEYCHVMLGRLRAVAGTRPVPPTRIQTFSEVARIFAYEAADEYRCDVFANSILQTVNLSVGDEEERQEFPVNLGLLFGDGYREGLVDTLDHVVYPGWPDLVDSYRVRDLSLTDMSEQLLRQTDGVLKLVAHADATAACSTKPAVLDDFSAHPGIALYLRDVWAPIRELVGRAPAGIPESGFGDMDRAVQACGARIVDLWARLGVTSRRIGDDNLYIAVHEPLR